MILVVTEKPSVATQLANMLGANKKGEGFWIGNNHIITWCYGHLVELAEPPAYDRKLEQWRMDTLPILPSRFQYIVTGNTRKQFEVIKGLMHRKDVSELIEATDAGREGELIFRLVYNEAGCEKPFRRLWINSLEGESIQEGLRTAKDGSYYDRLYQAALCRQQADWLIGINFTRLYSLLHRGTLPCGRVQTPTIAMVVQRWNDIKNFIPQKYYSIKADLGAFSAYTKVEDPSMGREILEKCIGEQAVVTKVVSEDKEIKAPKLYDLTALQREANSLLGYTAQQTLDYAQSLYEKELITYPRTDSRYISSSQEVAITDLLNNIKRRFSVLALKHQNSDIRQIINDKGITDHHALLPTSKILSLDQGSLPQGEFQLLAMIVQRLFVATMPPMRVRSTVATLDIEEHPFNARGREILSPSYQSLIPIFSPVIQGNQGDQEEREEPEDLPPMSDGNKYVVMNISMEDKKTKPPQAFTEGTLLKAMELAGTRADDPADRFSGGLGTAATRAGIIESIIRNKYIYRDGKKLIPTGKAYDLLSLAHPKLTNPSMTAEWERSFDAIQTGAADPESFMKGISDFLNEFIQNTKLLNKEDCFKEEYPIVGRCPRCGKNVHSRIKGYMCEQGKEACGFVVWKEIMGKKISEAQIKQLLATGKTGTIKGFEKAGKTFDATLKLGPSGKIEFIFPKR